MLTNSATATSARSPPDSSDSRLIFLPGGRASTSIPVVSMWSGSVRTSRPSPPGNNLLKTPSNWAAVSKYASAKTFSTRSSTSRTISMRSRLEFLRSSSCSVRNLWRSSSAAYSSSARGLTRPMVESLRSAERKLSTIGRVNPLALEEYAALEERHKFLTEPLEDLKNSKRDLMEIVREVDERVEKVFAEAYFDTAAQFEGVFSRLFPGGEGRLVLTDPDHMLTTGIEVEARPPGKKIKRLSLLSGGERSLVAVALLVSIFKARPSPFYIMDEVESSLDDANLGRLIMLLEELRDSSQLIVITHQKRTMEIADALYGVTMRGDGVTTVVSQRIRDVQNA